MLHDTRPVVPWTLLCAGNCLKIRVCQLGEDSTTYELDSVHQLKPDEKSQRRVRHGPAHCPTRDAIPDVSDPYSRRTLASSLPTSFSDHTSGGEWLLSDYVAFGSERVVVITHTTFLHGFKTLSPSPPGLHTSSRLITGIF